MTEARPAPGVVAEPLARRPGWLLAVAAALAGWLGFLAWMAWRN